MSLTHDLRKQPLFLVFIDELHVSSDIDHLIFVPVNPRWIASLLVYEIVYCFFIAALEQHIPSIAFSHIFEKHAPVIILLRMIWRINMQYQS